MAKCIACGRRVGTCHDCTPDSRRDAVIAAAEAFIVAVPGPSLMAVDCQKFGDLFKAVRALHTPTPVKPEEVEPGVWFRFAPDSEGKQDGQEYRLYATDDGVRWWVKGNKICSFSSTARILPLPDQD